ncbi:Origin recognition complex subunit 3 [Conoideocrella luteorostrata]|uniref:Origin recognition complex subunit 3 n=1 Tax=Conoideocrella luteorostrata TaxID=1105319 RepID=A0AAJ0FU64_9HYPO|nr:Origin recognition complex subunit 3 [Conoideocrella luteorostrata]
MDQGQDSQDTFSQEDHQVAYIFDPDQDENTRHQRPSKRRRVAKGPKKGAKTADEPPLFVPLFNGAEKTDFVKLRQRKFEESWGLIDQRIQNILRESNSATLEEVTKFVASAETECAGQIPSAFVITGPNIASQDLLFQQLSESLQQSVGGKFVRLKSSEAVTLKAALKKTIREAMASVGDEENDDLQVGNSQDTRRYLDYDLEALEVYIRPLKCEHVFVAFQDSEGFDSSLLSDLITLFQ